ncbi:MAG: hypothetical protein PF517_07435 [Salinivirgaceae bacterium]|jgi:hypothetical protein|nr:hypothetical protein [Salinivirgaceae bacterium]
MKKLAYVLVVMFVAALGTTTYASTVVVDNNETIVAVDFDNDKKPCPADCKGECCKAKEADGKTAKANCDKAAKVGCDKTAKKSCCSSAKAAAKTDGKTDEKAAPAEKK